MISFDNSELIEFYFYLLKYIGLNKLVFGSGQPLITGGQLKDLEVIIPKKDNHKKEIATILSDMDSEIENLEIQLSKYKELKQGLMQNLLTGEIRLV